MRRRTPAERFWDSQDSDGHEDGCYVWTAGKYPGGYGWIYFQGRKVGAHRFSWMLQRGPIPEGMSVLHSCDRPACVRIEHLHLGTQAQNMQECVARDRHARYQKSGEQNRSAKLTEAQVREIRKLLTEPGATDAQVARMFGVQRGTIYGIRAGRRWKQVA